MAEYCAECADKYGFEFDEHLHKCEGCGEEIEYKEFSFWGWLRGLFSKPEKDE